MTGLRNHELDSRTCDVLCELVRCDTIRCAAERLRVEPYVLSRYVYLRPWLRKRAFYLARSIAFARRLDLLQVGLNVETTREREAAYREAQRSVALRIGPGV